MMPEASTAAPQAAPATPATPAPSLGRRTLRGAAWSLAAQGVTALASLIAFALMGRMVGHAELGEYMLALVGVGAVQWLALNAYREPLIQVPTLVSQTRDAVFWFTLGIAALLACLLLAIAFVLQWRGAMPITAACLALLSVKVFFDTLASVPMAVCARDLRFPVLARISIVASVLGSLLSIGLLFAGWGVKAVAASQGFVAMLACVLTLRACAWRPRLFFSWQALAPLRAYSPYVVLWQGIEALNMYLDRFLVGTRLSPQALGVYGFGRRLNDVVIEVLVGAAGNVALPAYATLQHDRTALRAAYLRSMRAISFAVFPVIGILWCVADPLVTGVFGGKWASAVPIYRCFLLLGAIQTIGILQAALIRSLGFAKLWARYQVAQAVANILVLALAIDHGIFMLALAVVARTYLVWGYAVWMTCRLIDMPVREYLGLFLRPVLGSAAAGMVAAGVLHLLAGLPPLALVVGAGMLGGAAYLVLALAMMRPLAGELMALIARRA